MKVVHTDILTKEEIEAGYIWKLAASCPKCGVYTSVVYHDPNKFVEKDKWIHEQKRIHDEVCVAKS